MFNGRLGATSPAAVPRKSLTRRDRAQCPEASLLVDNANFLSPVPAGIVSFLVWHHTFPNATGGIIFKFITFCSFFFSFSGSNSSGSSDNNLENGIRASTIRLPMTRKIGPDIFAAPYRKDKVARGINRRISLIYLQHAKTCLPLYPGTR